MLITQQYKDLNQELHESRVFGNTGQKWAFIVAWIIERHKCFSVLDYGCGRGTIKNYFRVHHFDKISKYFSGLEFRQYDPGVKGRDTLPLKSDLVVCIDVLEHVEPECIDDVLDHIHALIKVIGFFVVNLFESKNVLPDGTNTHRLVKSKKWWMTKFKQHGFNVFELDFARGKREFICMVKK